MRRSSVVWGMGAPVAGAIALSYWPLQVQAQSALASSMLEEVVVTARRREESLEDLPLSIQSLSADVMQAQGIYNVEQISDFVPNLVLQDDIRTNDTRIFVRGVGGGFSNPAQVFGVGMYVDGHYLSGTLGAFMSTVDVERVEVLRGPQGTLFGKNTTGGAVSIISAKPHEEFESYVTLRAGEYGQQDIRGMINTPITDNLFLRVNAAKETSDGFYLNRISGEQVGGSDQTSVGVALRWEVGEHWMVDTRYATARDRDENRGTQCAPLMTQDVHAILTDPAYVDTYNRPDDFYGPDIPWAGQPYSGPGPVDSPEAMGLWGGASQGRGAGGSIDWIYPGALLDYVNGCAQDQAAGPWVTSQDMTNSFSNVDNDMFNINAIWDSNGQFGAFENATLQVQGAWRHTGYWYYQDRDGSPFIIDHPTSVGGNSSNKGVNRETKEIELIFNGDLTDRLNLTTGLYWFDDVAQTGDNNCLNDLKARVDLQAGTFDGEYICERSQGGTAMPRIIASSASGSPHGPNPVPITHTQGQTTGTSKAIYAHLTYDLTERWNMAVGARYSEDTRYQNNYELQQSGACLYDEFAGCDPTLLFNQATFFDGVPAQPGVNPALAAAVWNDLSSSYDAWTPSLSFTRSLDPGERLNSGNVYFGISRGYLTGAINDELPLNQMPNEEARQALATLIVYDPEYIVNYELGFKGTFNDGRLSLATAVFYMDYTDKHEAIDVPNPDGVLGPNEALEYITNVGEVGISGIEFELRTSLWDGGFVSIDAGMLNYDYKAYEYTNIVADPPTLITGVPALRTATPEWTISATIEHAFNLGGGGSLTPQLGIYMQDSYEWLTAFPNGDTVPWDSGYQSILCHQDSYAKLRARVTYEPADRGWQAALWGNNITDEAILQGCGATRSGTYRYFHQQPAQWGAEFTMRFGNRS